ncbi:MAG: sulfotransferase domain-containing protein [Hyphomonas sp.]
MPSPLPPAHRAKTRRESWTNFSVLRHGAFDGFLVTSKNSGTHWMCYMLAVALADTYGVERPTYFSENALRPYIGWATDKPVHAALPRLGRSHSIPHRLAEWDWARRLSGLPPYVLGVRHPMAILASHYAKWRHQLNTDWLDYLKGDPAGARFRCDLYWIARFWNRWGDICAAYPDAILCLHYEASRADPRAALEAIAAHWGIRLTPEAITAALAEGTKEAMARRIDPDAEPNVVQNRPETLEELFTGEAMDIYAARIRDLFRRDLGYDLMKPPVSGIRSNVLRAHS